MQALVYFFTMNLKFKHYTFVKKCMYVYMYVCIMYVCIMYKCMYV